MLSELELDFDLEVTGFEIAEIDVLIDGLEISVDRETQERAAEQQQNSPDKPDYEHRKAADFTDDELALIIQGIHPRYSK